MSSISSSSKSTSVPSTWQDRVDVSNPTTADRGAMRHRRDEKKTTRGLSYGLQALHPYKPWSYLRRLLCPEMTRKKPWFSRNPEWSSVHENKIHDLNWKGPTGRNYVQTLTRIRYSHQEKNASLCLMPCLLVYAIIRNPLDWPNTRGNRSRWQHWIPTHSSTEFW